MGLREELNAELKAAMRAKDKVRRDVIRSILAAVKESEQEKYEMLAKKAMNKHNVSKPSSPNDEEAVAAYSAAVDEALEAENVEERATLDDADIQAVIGKMVKMRRDSIAEAEEAGREDIAEAEQAELDVLMDFMPRQLTREEIRAKARVTIEEVGAESMQDMGRVMGILTQELKGQADGKTISEVVRAELSS
jgi:hypothetical protein